MAKNNKQQTRRDKINIPSDFIQLSENIISTRSTSYNENLITLNISKILNAHKIDFYIDDSGNIIAGKGEAKHKTFLCCHLDTVHVYKNGFNAYKNDFIYFAKDDRGKKVGVGGDDKNGIILCLHALINLDNILVCFFSQEESGGVGSSSVDKEILKDCKYMIGIDRWGNSDVITNYGGKTVSNEFLNDITPFLNKHKYKETEGMFTDVFNVQNDVELSAINVSCGYYEHHTETEYIDLRDLFACWLLVSDIHNNLKKVYPFEKYNNWGNYNLGINNKLHYDSNEMPETEKLFFEEDGYYICSNCGSDYIDREEAAHCCKVEKNYMYSSNFFD